MKSLTLYIPNGLVEHISNRISGTKIAASKYIRLLVLQDAISHIDGKMLNRLSFVDKMLGDDNLDDVIRILKDIQDTPEVKPEPIVEEIPEPTKLVKESLKEAKLDEPAPKPPNTNPDIEREVDELLSQPPAAVQPTPSPSRRKRGIPNSHS